MSSISKSQNRNRSSKSDEKEKNIFICDDIKQILINTEGVKTRDATNTAYYSI